MAFCVCVRVCVCVCVCVCACMCVCVCLCMPPEGYPISQRLSMTLFVHQPMFGDVRVHVRVCWRMPDCGERGASSYSGPLLD